MRILQVSDGYPPEPGVAGRFCRQLGGALAARGHDVRVSSLAGSGAAVRWGGTERDEGVSVRRCATSPPLRALHRLRGRDGGEVPPPWSAELRALLWSAREDVFHLHGSPPHAAWAWASSRIRRRGLVVTPHLAVERSLPRDLRWLLRRADAVVASEEECAWLRESGIRSDGLVPVETPVPGPSDTRGRCRDQLGLDPADRVLVFAGACDGERGAFTFVDAVRLLRLEGWRAVAVVLGAYHAEDDFMRRLWRASRVPVLELPVLTDGARSRLVAAADAVILPADWHRADLLEGRAAGTPVLAPAPPGRALASPDAVHFLAGSPPSLARVIADVLRRPARPSSSIAAATAPTWAAVAQQVEAIYERLRAARGVTGLRVGIAPRGNARGLHERLPAGDARD